MKVLIIGGTGLLGSEGARALIAKGHQVIALALPPLPEGAPLPPEMGITFGNYMEMPDEELSAHLQGCQGLVFAAGVDERLEGPPPIEKMFDRYNLAPLKRLLRLAKQNGVRHAVICGSYFCHFAREWPEMKLEERHPYIRSRIRQEEMAFSFVDEGFGVGVLQIPYVFGAQPGRRPVWMFLVNIIKSMPLATFYPKGGTAMVTARQVGQAMAAAIEKTEGAVAWPLGCVNMRWKEMLALFHRHMGMLRRPVITIPAWAFALGAAIRGRRMKKKGLEAGLDNAHLAELMSQEAFIDPEIGCAPLALVPEDMDAAIGESVRQCMNILAGREEGIGMKGE